MRNYLKFFETIFLLFNLTGHSIILLFEFILIHVIKIEKTKYFLLNLVCIISVQIFIHEIQILFSKKKGN